MTAIKLKMLAKDVECILLWACHTSHMARVPIFKKPQILKKEKEKKKAQSESIFMMSSNLC